MFRLALVPVAMLFVGIASGQRSAHYGSPSGFGNVNFPGLGHPPAVGAPGRVVTGPARGGFVGRPPVGHPGHSRSVIVPYPVIVGGYGLGYGYGYDPGAGGYGYAPDAGVAPAQQPVSPPVVIINQAYRPEPNSGDYGPADAAASSSSSGPLRIYEGPVHPFPDPNDQKTTAKAARPDDKPTIYLIAFKDHTILPSLAYWVEGDSLNYVTEAGVPNRASLALIDKEFSKQLNRERSVDFNLP